MGQTLTSALSFTGVMGTYFSILICVELEYNQVIKDADGIVKGKGFGKKLKIDILHVFSRNS